MNPVGHVKGVQRLYSVDLLNGRVDLFLEDLSEVLSESHSKGHRNRV
jgi:hypothetical protein